MTFRNRPLHNEADLCPHQEDLDPDAKYFFAVDGAATEEEYLSLIRSLVGIFKPSDILETGSYMGDGTFALLQALWGNPHQETNIVTICGDIIPEDVLEKLRLATSLKNRLIVICANTNDLIDNNTLADLTEGKTTFAFLDSSIPDRLKEFNYISNPANGVLDFTRPICVCVHDMSKYRHPKDSHFEYLQGTVEGLEKTANERGWQMLRINQSRGMIVLVRYTN